MARVNHPVYLVRHGQSEWNVLRRTQGQTAHPPLTSLGRGQASSAASRIGRDLGRDLRRARVDRIRTSDLVRAAETAAILQARLGGLLSTDVRLREQHLGVLEGRGYEETWAAADAHDWTDPTLPVAGGESLMDVHDRMASALAEVDPDEVTVLVSHGDAIRVAVACLHGVKPHEAEWVDVPNGAVARVVPGAGAVSWLP